MSNPDGPRLLYLDDIPTPYRLGVQRRIAEDWPGPFRLAYCAQAEPGRTWDLDFTGLDPVILPGSQWRPPRQVNPFSVKWNPGVGRALDAFQPDVVVLSGYVHPTMWMAARWCIANRVPYAVSCETSARNSASSGLRWFVKRAVAGWLVRNMAFGLPVGREAAEYLRRFGPCDVPMHYFPNTPDTAPIVEEAERLRANGGEPSLRAELGIAPDARIFLFVGRLIPAKRPLDAVVALSRAAGAEGAALVIVGDGELMPQVRAAADADPRIVTTGWIRDQALIAGLMSIATAMILPSGHEPWGAVVNEAMAAGTPVISSDRVGAATELIDDGVNGFLVPAGDVAGIAAAMEALLADPARADAMGAAARATAIAQGEEFAAGNLISGALAATAARRESK
ncbi:glycosyltransferase family 4 protein [Sphingomonas canadensis]|uniref:Glycosyltransferase family 4 protein n=1 Tax=Sphingomonas canadensis TaxID=1219257 RepID=A0ABW3H3R3_9SPHN|nr:glycosyltransferase family 4 protein [Sphingomonas canadensis]MCW3835404.1 glycosyltransferase family 4 protein [Sphingomonas canadensis]